ncbi:hypothetical protein KFK09_002376 [Dendrobium nobile]|uniref:DDE Tnp4 domain-containing protein n=1 Tax=Dendrobium nobile TaxID=94219 RepID=A0A8T3C4T6_DENNO|nr:hypothetical protein KFK09_002376 [Dendrobium nobile]
MDIIVPEDKEFLDIPVHIRNDTRYMPYFKDCIGAIDGTHVDARIPVEYQIPYIGRHHSPTQNVMAVCDFNMCFTFVAVGWEGSAHDARIFKHVLRSSLYSFPVPPSVATMALHNYIRRHHSRSDPEFDECDADENFVHSEAREFRVEEEVEPLGNTNCSVELVDGEGAKDMAEVREAIAMQLYSCNRCLLSLDASLFNPRTLFLLTSLPLPALRPARSAIFLSVFFAKLKEALGKGLKFIQKPLRFDSQI